MTTTFLSHFTPSLMKPDALEAIFVQREELVQRITDLIRESALTQSKHYTLLIGPRGIGKTHVMALVYHRIQAMEDLRDRLLIAWLREEEWGVTSFLDLLLSIFRALREEYEDPALAERVESLYSLPPDAAERAAAELLKEFVGDRALVVLMENLNDLFGGLGDEGQKRLRSYLQENPSYPILATAQSLFSGVSLQTSPFYGFFRIYHLEDLDFEDVILLLTKIADFEGDQELASFIRTPKGRARVRAVHHLAGGNHRVYVIFSQFINHKSLDELVEPFVHMLDDLTLYYQERMARLSPQQRKIVEFLCDRRHAIPVKEIAQRRFMTHQTASGQLKALRDMGYVRSIPIGRDSYYELREPLMRLCVEVKKQRGEPIRLFVDFLRLWYSREELQQRLVSIQPGVALEQEYLLSALQVTEQEAEDPRVAACLQDYYTYSERDDFVQALQAAKELVAIRGDAQDLLNQGYSLGLLGRYEEALTSFDKVIELDPNKPLAWLGRGMALSDLRRYDEALVSYDKVIELDPYDASAWSLKSWLLAKLGRYDEALISYDKTIELDPNDALAWCNRGASLLNLERYDEALISYDKGIELDPDDALAWYNRGVSLSKLERYSEALVSYDKSIEFDPNYAPTWNNRGVSLGMLERYDEALTSFDKAVELDPNDALSWNSRGWVLANLGRHDEALSSCNKAVELGEQSWQVFFNQAEFLLALNRWEEGMAALDDALHRFADADEPNTGDTESILRNLFTSTLDAATWRTRIAALIEIYDKHQVVSALGQGLVRSIPALTSPMISDAAARTWWGLWKELAGKREEFEIPLRLLDVAVRYQEKHDRRVLLELPVEEHKLLKPLLGIEDSSEA